MRQPHPDRDHALKGLASVAWSCTSCRDATPAGSRCGRSPRAATADGAARGRPGADLPPGRPDGGGGTQRGSRDLQSARCVIPVRRAGRALARGDLVEHLGRVRPWADMALYRAEMAGWADREDLLDWEEHQREWVDANDACRRDILDRLEIDGPLTSAQLPDTCWVPWRSSGWNNNRNVGRLLEFMVCRGEVAVAGRRGREKLWDLAERVYPDEAVPEDEALRERARRWLRSLGIARATRTENARESAHAATVGEPAVVEGVRGMWRVDPAQLGQPFTGRTALLSPLDRLVFDRPRMADLFEFDYQLEMYKPAAKRRWGYYALPILSGDRLVGKLDATADRRAGALRVTAVHEDAPSTRRRRRPYATRSRTSPPGSASNPSCPAAPHLPRYGAIGRL
ncbi:DNA glycosylase AlkZ-like family protein [Luedemannella flava]